MGWQTCPPAYRSARVWAPDVPASSRAWPGVAGCGSGTGAELDEQVGQYEISGGVIEDLKGEQGQDQDAAKDDPAPETGFACQGGVIYSYFNAFTGIIVAARKAGYNPEMRPIMVAKMSAKAGNQNGVETATLGGILPVSADCPAR